MNTINILFLGGAKRLSLVERFILAGKILGVDINFFSYELSELVPIAKYAKIIIGKKFNDKDVITDLYRNIDYYNINIIIPNIDPAISIAAKLKNHFPNVFIPVSSESVADVFFDKQKSNTWFVDNDFPVPIYKGVFPALAKPRFGSASHGLIKLNNEHEYQEFKTNHNADDYLIQEFIESDEFTVDAYVNKNGVIMGIVPRIRLEITGGEASLSKTILDSEIMAYSNRLLSIGNFIGPITIQFLREKKSNKCFILEVNPRLGGGVILSIEAGFNIPLFILSEFLGSEVNPISSYQNGLVMSRAFQEVFIATNN